MSVAQSKGGDDAGGAGRVVVVVPCYRPQPGWGALLAERFAAFAKTQSAGARLVLSHDGTPGGLAPEELRRLRRGVPDVEILDSATNRGKGAALRAGVAFAGEAPITLYTDVDLPYTLASMQRVAEHVRVNGGVAAGERDERYYAQVPRFRRWLSRAHRRLMRTAFRLPVSDSQAGLKAFDAVGRRVFLGTSVDRFLVDLDFIARCRGRVAVEPVKVELRAGVTFTDFGADILRAEAANFVNILKRTWRLG